MKFCGVPLIAIVLAAVCGLSLQTSAAPGQSSKAHLRKPRGESLIERPVFEKPSFEKHKKEKETVEKVTFEKNDLVKPVFEKSSFELTRKKKSQRDILLARRPTDSSRPPSHYVPVPTSVTRSKIFK